MCEEINYDNLSPQELWALWQDSQAARKMSELLLVLPVGPSAPIRCPQRYEVKDA